MSMKSPVMLRFGALAPDRRCVRVDCLLGVDSRSGDTDVHHLRPTAPSHPADRSGVEVVPADGQPAMPCPGRLHMGDVDPMPTLCLAQPCLRPCMAGSLSDMPGAEIPAHVAGRDT